MPNFCRSRVSFDFLIGYISRPGWPRRIYLDSTSLSRGKLNEFIPLVTPGCAVPSADTPDLRYPMNLKFFKF